jgi:hypothetical protein
MNLQPGETAKEAAESTSAESLHRSSWDSRFVVDSLAEGLGIIFFFVWDPFFFSTYAR